ncbi:hypothetical protein MWU65_17315 [Cellulophaga sp. F20128]|uniref:hypothetical protein n=1 Tax=Cellulophaga sp. F20128 TaxID=2926413 RepID=UPI001FF1D8D1|nr:hypothetical protein [Cellulophaga sp. F20128]MCK0158950.1 hypothetical protein [Cellulophaga sp. F20128]
MKISEIKLKIILGLLLIPFSLIGQEANWFVFQLENIKIDFPTEEVYQLDTIVKGVRINQLYTQIGISTLIIQKLPAESSTKDKDLSSLPYNYESLIEYYEGVIDGVKNSSKAEKEEIKLGELIGYKSIIYNDIEKPIMESRTFLAGNDLIMLSIYNPAKELNDIKETFFSSVNLDGLDSLEQYTGKSKAYRQGYVFGKLFFYAILGIGIFFLIRKLRKKK